MKNPVITPDRRGEVKALAAIVNNAKECKLKSQMESLSDRDNELTELEFETLDLKALFETLCDFKNSQRVQILYHLHAAFDSYIQQHPHMSKDAFTAFSEINTLISGIYYYNDLIESKCQDYTALSEAIDEINNSTIRAVS